MSSTAAGLSARPASPSPAIRMKAGSISALIAPWCMTRKSVGLFMSSAGKHGRMHMEKYFKQGKPCPVVLCVGQDPLLLLAAGNPIELGIPSTTTAAASEAGPTISSRAKSPACPFPPTRKSPSKAFFIRATSSPTVLSANGSATTARVWKTRRCCASSAIYHRNDPILCVARPGRPPTDYSLSKGMIRAAQLWDRVEKAGLPNVKGVWSLESGIGSLFNVISIKQAYPGHSRQALFLASQSLGGAYNGRFVVVVDEDIDPTSEFDVLWAMATRCDPDQAVEIISRAASGSLDVCIPPENKGHSSRCLIDACMPYDRRHQFPPIAESSEELKNQVRAKWRETIYE